MDESRKHLSELFGLVQFDGEETEPKKKRAAKSAEESSKLGAQALADGDSDQAIEHFERAVAQSNGLSRYQIDLATAYEFAGKEEEAEELLWEVVNRDPDEIEARVCLAEMLQRQARISEAIDLLERASAKQPDNASLHFQLADICRDSNLVSKALAAAERAALVEPTNPFYHQWLGEYLLTMGKFEIALEPLRQAVELSPGDDHSVFITGIAFWGAGKLSDAEKAIEMAVSLDEDNKMYLATLQKLKHKEIQIDLDDYDSAKLNDLLVLIGE